MTFRWNTLAPALFLSASLTHAGDANFSKDAKGIIHCDSAVVGESGMVDGMTYTKIGSKEDLFYYSGGLDINATLACTSGITDMSSWFNDFHNGDRSFREDISHWDTGSVTTMASMFRGFRITVLPIGNWDTSKVTDMHEMFHGANFNAPIGEWDTGSVTTMEDMFSSNRKFNQPIGSWDTSSVQNMSYMFSDAQAFNQPIGEWDTGNATHMNSMFYYASAFNQPLGEWSVRNVINMDSMFRHASSFNQDLSSWCVKQFGTAPYFFASYSPLDSNPSYHPVWGECPFRLDPNGVTVHCDEADINDTDTIDGIIYTKIGSKNDLLIHGGSVDAAQACTSGITDMSAWFYLKDSFNKDIRRWDTGDVTDMTYMFEGAQIFNQPIGHWDTANVTLTYRMFQFAITFNQPIGEWDMSNVTNMFGMFFNAYAFNQPIGNWDTGNVTVMSGVFGEAISFNQPIGNWDTSNVENMDGMFNKAIAFNRGIHLWCVPKIMSKPPNFDLDTAAGFENNTARQPIWGSCPSFDPAAILYLMK